MTVALTTDRFDQVAHWFSAAGLEPLHLPCIRVDPASEEALQRARDAASKADILLLTSPRTVGLLWPGGGMPDAEVCAVGRVTAAAVTEAGGRVGVTGRGGLARLVDAAADQVSGKRVVLAHAASADSSAMARLEALTPHMEEHCVYRVAPVGPADTPADVVVFASPSAVEGWLLSRSLDVPMLATIGETTTQALAQHRTPDVTAPSPSYQALARALASILEVKV